MGSSMSNRYAAYTRLKIDYPAARVLRLTFDRPETYNSVDAATHTQLTDIWRDIDDDPDINAVIVTGAGKAFSAGDDFELGPLFDTSTALEILGFTGAEAREGLASHLEKRAPSFPKDCPI